MPVLCSKDQSGVTLGSLLLLARTCANGVGSYSVGHHERNIDLISRLSGVVRFDVEGSTAPNQAVQMTDHVGQQYRCTLGNKTKGSERRAKSKDGSTTTIFMPPDLDQQLKDLEGICADFRLGWWSYRWCHKQQVTQFHKETDGSAVGKTTNIGIFDPERTKIQKEVKGSGTGTSVTYFFTKGSAKGCTDAVAGRTAEVTLSCCRKVDTQHADSVIQLSSFKETETCKYEFKLCTSLLCKSSDPRAEQKAPTIRQLLKPLENVCMQKHDGWWTYDFCYRQHIRQVHLQTVANKNGKQETKVVSEYLLGKFNGKKSLKSSDVDSPELIRPSLEDPDRKAFVQDYTAGVFAS